MQVVDILCAATVPRASAIQRSAEARRDAVIGIMCLIRLDNLQPQQDPMVIHAPLVKLTIPHAMDAMFREVRCGAHGLSAATSAKIFDTLLTCLVCLTPMMLLLFHR